MPEISACDLDKLRMDAEIARRVHLAEGHLPRPRPQAPETHAQGTYRPPRDGQSNYRRKAILEKHPAPDDAGNQQTKD